MTKRPGNGSVEGWKLSSRPGTSAIPLTPRFSPGGSPTTTFVSGAAGARGASARAAQTAASAAPAERRAGPALMGRSLTGPVLGGRFALCEERVDLVRERARVERLVLRSRAGALEQRAVAREPGEPQVGEARLLRAAQLALAAQLEVLLREL